jgi:hypothetical protein
MATSSIIHGLKKRDRHFFQVSFHRERNSTADALLTLAGKSASPGL